MKTAATEMFGIDIPIFAFSHCRDVVAAVSKAGGMGVLGAVAHSSEQLTIDLEWIEAELRGLPYGVDVIVPAVAIGSETAATIGDVAAMIPEPHRAFVDEMLARYDVPPLPEDQGGGRFGWRSEHAAPFSLEQVGAQLNIALGYEPALFVNALGPPPGFMIDQVKAAGRRVGALAGKVQHAARHVSAGVDLIIAQGSEAGGHTGEIGTMVLVPEVVDAVHPVPVLGAGGIARGRQMAAAMALGAAGVWCGSVWLTTTEAETHPVVKDKFLAATMEDTTRSRSLTGKPARQLKSAWTEEWDDPGTPEPLDMPLQPILIDEAIARIDRAAHTKGSGAERLINYFVGQVVGSLREVKPTSQVIFEMVDEFVDTINTLGADLED